MIYIVRHGQTAWNLKKRKQGRKDSPLTLLGIEQARKTAITLQNKIPNICEFKVVISHELLNNLESSDFLYKLN